MASCDGCSLVSPTLRLGLRGGDPFPSIARNPVPVPALNGGRRNKEGGTSGRNVADVRVAVPRLGQCNVFRASLHNRQLVEEVVTTERERATAEELGL